MRDLKATETTLNAELYEAACFEAHHVARYAQYLDKQYIPSRYPSAFDEGAQPTTTTGATQRGALSARGGSWSG